jgi:hypothetical protein
LHVETGFVGRILLRLREGEGEEEWRGMGRVDQKALGRKNIQKTCWWSGLVMLMKEGGRGGGTAVVATVL